MLRPVPPTCRILSRSGLLVAVALGLLAGAGGAPQAQAGDATDALFRSLGVPELALTVAEADVARLREAPRTYVPARLREDGQAPDLEVAVKLKGAAGSFREVDDRPALTLDVNRRVPGQRFHGLVKLHLNNSVQDESLLCEGLGADLFAAAGLAAPRVTWARVRLNDRDLGLYVLKEGVDRRFLERAFADPTGNLYDGGFCQDVDGELERDAGHGPQDRSDLAALVAACQEPDLLKRAGRIPRVLDVEHLLTFVALERVLAHWDGYAQNRNNYRLYLEPPSGRARFLPQGMDQLFGDPEASVLDACVGLVAVGVLEVPAWRAGYRERLREVLRLARGPRGLHAALARRAPVLERAFEAFGPEALAAQRERVRDLGERVTARLASVAEQVERPDPPALEFDRQGRAFVTGWQPRVEEGEPTLEQVSHAGRRALGIVCPNDGGGCVASWRRRLALPAGRYTFTAEMAVKGVIPRPDVQGRGAGLRISGATRAGGLSGAAIWRRVDFDFEVSEVLRSVELVAELRATQGQAYVDVASLRLTRRGP